jgi:hypothetical protein
MKRSASVRLVLVQGIAAAALAAGCGSPGSTRTCVDRDGLVTTETNCVEEERRPRTMGYLPYYHWYYVRGRTYVPRIGTRAPAGGSLTADMGGTSHSSATVRGGFGSSAGHSAAS